MEPLIVSAVLAALLTFLVVAIELPTRSKQSPRACLSYPTFLYLVISLLGNELAMFAAFKTVPFGEFENWRDIGSALVGVFAFEGMMKQINVTLFDKGVLTISDWISKARDFAISSAYAKQSKMGIDKSVKNANLLESLSEQILNTYLANANQDVQQINALIAESGSVAKMYKAMTLVNVSEPDVINAIINERNLGTGETPRGFINVFNIIYFLLILAAAVISFKLGDVGKLTLQISTMIR